jgi:hypothetical protein
MTTMVIETAIAMVTVMTMMTMATTMMITIPAAFVQCSKMCGLQ